MASPAYRSLSQNFVFTGSNDVVTGPGTDPAGAANGDGLVMVVCIDSVFGGAATPGTVTGPTGGWTFLGSVTGSSLSVYAWSIRRGAGVPDYSCSWVNGSGYSETYVVAASGVVATGEVLDTSAIGTVTTTTTPDPPSVSIATIETLALAVGVSGVGWTSAATPPTGYTDRSSGATFTTALATKTVAAAGTENPSAFSAADSSQPSVGLTFVFASQAAAAGGVEVPVPPGNTMFFGGSF